MSNSCEAKNFVPPQTLWRWNFFNWMVPILLAALLLGLWGLERQYARIQGPIIESGPPSEASVLRGSGSENSTVEVYLDDQFVGTADVDANRQWSLATGTISDSGDHEFVAYALDPDGRRRGDSDSWAFTIGDAVAEESEFSAPTLALSRSNNNFVLYGAGTPDTTVELFNNGESIGIADVGADGTWSLTTLADPSGGSFVARGLAPDGSDIGESDVVDYTPAALTAGAAALLGSTYMWSGTGEPGSTVAVMRDGERVGTTRVDSNGNWSFTGSARDLPAGDYTLSASALDTNGNTLASADQDTTFSIAPPEFMADNVTLAADGRAFTWSGTGAPGSEVVVMLDGEEIGRTTVDDDGMWSFDSSLANLDAGDYELSAQMLDSDGNVAGDAVAASPLTVAALPALAVGDVTLADDGASFSWSGTGAPGSEVVIMLNGEEIGRTTVDDDGTWSFDGDLAGLDAGDYELTSQMLNSDGAVADEMTASSPLSIAAASNPLTTGDAALADDGASFSWSGTGAPGSEVVIMLNGEEIGRTTVDDDGTWSFDGDLAGLDAGDYELTSQMLNSDGAVADEMTASSPLSIAAASNPLTTGDVTLADDGASFSWSGTGAPGAEVVIMLNGEEIGRTTVGDDGTWAFDGDLAGLDAGDYELTAQMLDSDGAVADEMTASSPLIVGSATASASAGATGQVQVLLPNGDPDTDTIGTAPTGAPAVSLILDSSWSMTFGVDYTGQDIGPNTDESQRLTADNPNSRIAVAKAGLIEFIEVGMPEGTPTALRVFGNLRGDLQCQTDLMVPYGPLDPDTMIATIGDVEPAFNANTAIARSLELIAEDLADASEGNRNIVLVTDGDETCGGDPQAVIESLAAQGFNTTVNIIGFSINDDALKSKLESWAEAGNGQFFDAADADSLAESLRDAFAVRYIVRDTDGNEVATGLVGGDPIALPVGEYSVLVLTEPTQTFDIEVTVDETTVIMAE